jgi:hypothetical protein
VTDLRIGGAPVQPWQAFRVTVNTSLAGGGDRFTVLHTGTSRSGGPADTEALERHLTPSLTGVPLLPPGRDRIDRIP